jgi:hypothetical protein
MGNLRGGRLLAAGLLSSALAWSQTAAAITAEEARKIEEVMGPVDAAHPLDDSVPLPSDSTAEAPQSVPPEAVPPTVPVAQAPRSAQTAKVTTPEADNTHVGISTNVHILTGIGLSIGIPVLDQFNLRLSGNAFSITRDFDQNNDNGGSNTYKGKVKLLSYGLLADWHPFHGAFRVTAGGLKNGNKITLDSSPNGSSVDIGNCSYTSNPNDPLLAHGQTNFRGFAPYAGLGWGGNMNAAPGFFGTFDLGVMFSGSANIGLSAKGSGTVRSGPVGECGAPGTAVNANDPQVQAQVAKDQADLNDKTDKVKLWPVIGFGFGWRF